MFLLAEVSDWTGTCTVRLGERVALGVTGCSKREEFMEAYALGTLRFQRVHLRLKRSIVQDGKHVSLVAVCACPAFLCPPVSFIGPLLDAKIIPAKVSQLRNIPYGGLAVEVKGDLVPVRAALLLLSPGQEREDGSEGGTLEVRLTAARDACPEGAAEDVCATVAASHECKDFLEKDDAGLLLVHATNAIFDSAGSLVEICCTEVQLVPSSEEKAAAMFGEELLAVQARVAQARGTGNKRKFNTAALSWDEYFTPEKRRVCFGIQSPPTSRSESAQSA